MSDQDAFKYWQDKLGTTDKKANVGGRGGAGTDSDEELDEEFSGSEVKFSEPNDDEDDEYSMNDEDDFTVSQSLKQAPGKQSNPSSIKKPTAAKASGSKETVSAAQERLNKILEEEKKQAREAKLKEIMRQQKAALKQELGSDEDDDDDSDFENDSDEEESKNAAKKPSAAKATASGGKKKDSAYDYFLKKQGKQVEESSEISMEEEPEEIPVVENSQNSIGAGLVAAKPKPAVIPKKASAEDSEDGDFSPDEDFEEDSDEQQNQKKPQPPAKAQAKVAAPQLAKATVKPKPIIQPAKPVATVKEIPIKKDSPKASEIESDEDIDEFEESEIEEADQAINNEPEAPPKVQTKPPVEAAKLALQNSEPEEVQMSDFEEESMDVEVVDKSQLTGASQTYSIHDAESENKDTVPDMDTRRKPGNSTVNMASVVPHVKAVQPESTINQAPGPVMNQTMEPSRANEGQESSPMFVKGKSNSKALSPPAGKAQPEIQENPSRPSFVKNTSQVIEKQVSIKRKDASPSPNRRQAEEDEINEQLKEIKPRYPNGQKAPIVAKSSQRPQTAKPAPATQARVSSNNRDLTKVSVPQQNNFTQSQQSTTQKQSQTSLKPARPTSASRPMNQPIQKKPVRPTSAIPSKGQPTKPVEKVNYAEVSLAQPPEEKKFFKYEPKKRLPVSVVPKAPPKPRRNQQPEVVADEENSQSPARSPNQDLAHVSQAVKNAPSVGAASLPGSIGGLLPSFGSTGLPGLDIVASIQQTVVKAAEKAKANAAKPGSAWGSRVVPDTKKKYELPEKLKPKIKEETKKASTQKSKLGVIKKEEVHVKEKNPPIPSHKVEKKPAGEGQENASANKPKGGAKHANVVVHGSATNKGSINAFDPLAQLTGNQKLAQLKKQKQQQTKDSLSKQLTQSGVISINRPPSGVAKKKKTSVPQYKMPAKNRPFDNNDDLNDMFGEEELMGGDQGAPPGMEDEFGAADLLQGDQGGNFEDQLDMNADKEDVEFMKEIAGPQKKPAGQKVARQNSAASKQSAKRESDWAGNGLGSGNLQQQKKQDEAAIGRKSTNMALQPAKKQAEPKPIPWGFNANAKTKVEVNAEEQQAKKQEAQRKFKELQQEKAERARNANPSLNVFMAQMDEMDKKGKKDAKKGAVNPLIKNSQVNEVNPSAFVKTGADRVPAEAGNVHDNESNSKMVQDLQNELKQLFYENKKTNKQVQKIEKRKIGVSAQLENLIAEKNLVKINGKLEAKTEIPSQMKRILKSADIPDYDKIAERANPLEPVVAKFAERGFTPLAVFTMLDIEDEDDILTFSEIKNGLKRLKITLLDTEWKLLFDAIDKDGDGCVTIEEWQEILQPKMNAQKEFINIMKGLNINDPLMLEEQILDILFKKRRLAGEVKVMRSKQNQEQFFRKKQIEQEQKAMASKIKELQESVKNSRERTEEERETFDEKMRSGLQTQADVEAEYEMLIKSKREIEIEQGTLEQEHKKELMAQNQLHEEVSQYAITVKRDRDRKKMELKKMTVKLQLQREAEAKLDKELEAILGRAVTMADLEALYLQDLKLLGSIEAGIGNKIGSMREIIMARFVQKAWRGYVARKRVKALRQKRKDFINKYGVFMRKTTEAKKERAVSIIIRHWRNYKAKNDAAIQARDAQVSNELAELRAKNRKLTQEQLRIQEWAVTVLQKNWRAFVERRKYNKSVKFVSSGFNPFTAFVRSQKESKSKAMGKFNYHETRYCLQCDENPAERQCFMCEDNLFCKSCFVEVHIIGAKKRHFYFEITYDKDYPEGPSTWNQPAMRIADLPERESSFIRSELSDSSDSSSFERLPRYDASAAAASIMQRKEIIWNPFMPSHRVNMGGLFR